MWRKPAKVMIDTALPHEDLVLAGLHAASFARGWDASEFERYLIDPAYLCLVARRTRSWGGDEVIGFTLFRTALDEAELLSIAVAVTERGQGVGRALLETGLRHLFSSGMTEIFLEVAEANESALKLYQRLGFKLVSRREAYYALADGSKAAALVMRLDLR